MAKDATKAKLAQLEALRNVGEAEITPHVRRALSDRSAYLVAKAAALVAERFLVALMPDVQAAFDRLMRADAAIDPLAEAKLALAKALRELDCRDAEVFLRGLRHVQLKPAWGEPVDVAASLRGTCALALVSCDIDDAALLREFVDFLVIEREKIVRVDVVRAIGEMGGMHGMLVLRLKALCGDPDAEVVGECLTALMQREPSESTPFVVRFLEHDRPDIGFEAACALAASRDDAAQTAVARVWHGLIPPEMRRAIIFSCAASASPLAGSLLLEIVSDPRPDLGGWAVAALAASRFREEYRERVRQAVLRSADTRLGDIFAREFAPAPQIRGAAI